MITTRAKFLKSLRRIEKGDAVFLIEVNEHSRISDELGILQMDHFTDYVNHSIYDFLKQSSFMGRMAHLNDSTIGLHMKNSNDSGACEEFAIKLCEALDTLTYMHNENKVAFCMNIGILCCPEDRMDVAMVMAKAEDSCRRARNLKGNAFVMYGDTDVDQAVDTELGKAVYNALKGGHIKSLYQALMAMSDAAQKDKRKLYQARTIILDSNNKTIEPREFLPVLKKTNTLKTLDHWIIRSSMEEVARLDDTGENFGVLIPLSDVLFEERNLAEWTEKMSENLAIAHPGSHLFFEITASEFLNNHQLASLQLNRLRATLKSALVLSNVAHQQALEKCLKDFKFEYVMFSPEYAPDKCMSDAQMSQLVKYAQKAGALTIASKISSGTILTRAIQAGADYVMGFFIQPQLEHITLTETLEIT